MRAWLWCVLFAYPVADAAAFNEARERAFGEDESTPDDVLHRAALQREADRLEAIAKSLKRDADKAMERANAAKKRLGEHKMSLVQKKSLASGKANQSRSGGDGNTSVAKRTPSLNRRTLKAMTIGGDPLNGHALEVSAASGTVKWDGNGIVTNPASRFEEGGLVLVERGPFTKKEQDLQHLRMFFPNHRMKVLVSIRGHGDQRHLDLEMSKCGANGSNCARLSGVDADKAADNLGMFYEESTHITKAAVDIRHDETTKRKKKGSKGGKEGAGRGVAAERKNQGSKVGKEVGKDGVAAMRQEHGGGATAERRDKGRRVGKEGSKDGVRDKRKEQGSKGGKQVGRGATAAKRKEADSNGGKAKRKEKGKNGGTGASGRKDRTKKDSEGKKREKQKRNRRNKDQRLKPDVVISEKETKSPEQLVGRGNRTTGKVGKHRKARMAAININGHGMLGHNLSIDIDQGITFDNLPILRGLNTDFRVDGVVSARRLPLKVASSKQSKDSRVELDFLSGEQLRVTMHESTPSRFLDVKAYTCLQGKCKLLEDAEGYTEIPRLVKRTTAMGSRSLYDGQVKVNNSVPSDVDTEGELSLGELPSSA